MMCVLYVFLGGSHYGIISVAGLFYPTARRGLGTGWAAGIGKLGSMAGPWLGGWLMAANLAPRTFAVLAIFPAVFCVCMLAIGLLERRSPHAA
jgi:AAHS family 4-hydroxybenzoate transporter-like MFS transporter